MQKILKVARREYIETIKTKTFIFGVLMTPVIIGGIIFFTILISRDKGGPRPPYESGCNRLVGRTFSRN